MKRIGLSVGFLIAGLLTSWAAMVAGSHLPFRFHVKLLRRDSSACYEIGPCSVSWWVTAALVAYILGPSFIFMVTGWLSARPGVTTSKKLSRLLLLAVFTVLLYLLGYVIS